MWAVHLSGAEYVFGSEGVTPHYGLDRIGYDIAALTLLHAGQWHIMGNTIALLPTLGAIAYMDRWPIVTVILVAAGGAFFLYYMGPPDGIPHKGASILSCGLVAYVIVYGLRQVFATGDMITLLIVAVIAFFQGIPTIQSALPQPPPMSWEGHAAGIVMGALWGLLNKR